MPLKTKRDEQPNVNLTPMIDIVFLLIIFFMVGTKSSEIEKKIALKVPEVSNAGALSSAPEKRIVNVYRDGKITLDQKNVSVKELIKQLTNARKQYKELGVLVRGDGEVNFDRVAKVINAVKQAGITKIAISVKPKKQK